MAKSTFILKNLISTKFLILISLGIFLSLNNVTCMRYNRSFLEDDYPLQTNDSENNYDDEKPLKTSLNEIEEKEDIKEEDEEEQDKAENGDDYNDEDDEEDEEEDEEDEEENLSTPDDYLDRNVDSSLIELENEMYDEDYGADNNDKNPNDNLLRDYLEKIGALDKLRKGKERGKNAINSFKSKINSIPSKYKAIKGNIYPRRNNQREYSTSGEYNKDDHRKRLLNTMNEVDRKRNNQGGHISSENEKKVDHRARLFNTMKEVDRRRNGQGGNTNEYEDTKKISHRKRLINTMNEVDRRRNNGTGTRQSNTSQRFRGN